MTRFPADQYIYVGESSQYGTSRFKGNRHDKAQILKKPKFKKKKCAHRKKRGGKAK